MMNSVVQTYELYAQLLLQLASMITATSGGAVFGNYE